MPLATEPQRVVLADLPIVFWRGVTNTLDTALKAEHLDDAARERVINTVVYGHKDGPDAYARANLRGSQPWPDPTAHERE